MRGITEDGQTDEYGAKNRQMCHKKTQCIALTINAKDNPPHIHRQQDNLPLPLIPSIL